MKRNLGSLKKGLIPELRHEEYKKSQGHSMILECKEVLKK